MSSRCFQWCQSWWQVAFLPFISLLFLPLSLCLTMPLPSTASSFPFLLPSRPPSTHCPLYIALLLLWSPSLSPYSYFPSSSFTLPTVIHSYHYPSVSRPRFPSSVWFTLGIRSRSTWPNSLQQYDFCVAGCSRVAEASFVTRHFFNSLHASVAHGLSTRKDCYYVCCSSQAHTRKHTHHVWGLSGTLEQASHLAVSKATQAASMPLVKSKVKVKTLKTKILQACVKLCVWGSRE